MANTAIYTEGGLVLNSEKCQNYSLLIIDIGENFDQEDYIPPTIQSYSTNSLCRLCFA